MSNFMEHVEAATKHAGELDAEAVCARVEEDFVDAGLEAEAGPAKPLRTPKRGRVERHKASDKFLIIYGRKRKFSRLHLMGKCYWSRAEVRDCYATSTALPEMYNSRCKLCWPELVEVAEEEGPPDEPAGLPASESDESSSDD